MGMIKNGIYRTLSGSTVTVSGEHSGIAVVEFDWLEETNACFECKPNPMPEDDGDRIHLTWSCDYCGGGTAILHEVEPLEFPLW